MAPLKGRRTPPSKALSTSAKATVSKSTQEKGVLSSDKLRATSSDHAVSQRTKLAPSSSAKATKSANAKKPSTLAVGVADDQAAVAQGEKGFRRKTSQLAPLAATAGVATTGAVSASRFQGDGNRMAKKAEVVASESKPFPHSPPSPLPFASRIVRLSERSATAHNVSAQLLLLPSTYAPVLRFTVQLRPGLSSSSLQEASGRTEEEAPQPNRRGPGGQQGLLASEQFGEAAKNADADGRVSNSDDGFDGVADSSSFDHSPSSVASAAAPRAHVAYASLNFGGSALRLRLSVAQPRKMAADAVCDVMAAGAETSRRPRHPPALFSNPTGPSDTNNSDAAAPLVGNTAEDEAISSSSIPLPHTRRSSSSADEAATLEAIRSTSDVGDDLATLLARRTAVDALLVAGRGSNGGGDEEEEKKAVPPSPTDVLLTVGSASNGVDGGAAARETAEGILLVPPPGARPSALARARDAALGKLLGSAVAAAEARAQSASVPSASLNEANALGGDVRNGGDESTCGDGGSMMSSSDAKFIAAARARGRWFNPMSATVFGGGYRPAAVPTHGVLFDEDGIELPMPDAEAIAVSEAEAAAAAARRPLVIKAHEKRVSLADGTSSSKEAVGPAPLPSIYTPRRFGPPKPEATAGQRSCPLIPVVDPTGRYGGAHYRAIARSNPSLLSVRGRDPASLPPARQRRLFGDAVPGGGRTAASKNAAAFLATGAAWGRTSSAAGPGGLYPLVAAGRGRWEASRHMQMQLWRRRSALSKDGKKAKRPPTVTTAHVVMPPCGYVCRYSPATGELHIDCGGPQFGLFADGRVPESVKAHAAAMTKYGAYALAESYGARPLVQTPTARQLKKAAMKAELSSSRSHSGGDGAAAAAAAASVAAEVSPPVHVSTGRSPTVSLSLTVGPRRPIDVDGFAAFFGLKRDDPLIRAFFASSGVVSGSGIRALDKRRGRRPRNMDNASVEEDAAEGCW